MVLGRRATAKSMRQARDLIFTPKERAVEVDKFSFLIGIFDFFHANLHPFICIKFRFLYQSSLCVNMTFHCFFLFLVVGH